MFYCISFIDIFKIQQVFFILSPGINVERRRNISMDSAYFNSILLYIKHIAIE